MIEASVCTTWLVNDRNYFLLDLVRGRFEYPLLRDTAIELSYRFKPHTVSASQTWFGAVALKLRLSKFGAIGKS